MKTSRRKELKVELEKHLLPLLHGAWFMGPTVFRGNDSFFRFHRRQGPRHHFITIQFEKVVAPSFGSNSRKTLMRASRNA